MDARVERAQLLRAEADRLARLLVARGASLVVVFGSLARGAVRSSSDLDLLAVMPSDLSFIKRLERLSQELEPRVGLDLLVYTPEEFAEMRHRTFVKRALAEGQVLYAA